MDTRQLIILEFFLTIFFFTTPRNYFICRGDGRIFQAQLRGASAIKREIGIFRLPVTALLFPREFEMSRVDFFFFSEAIFDRKGCWEAV